MFSSLEKHAAIGWDFDLTLVNSAASNALQDFIKRTPGIRHYIITFRTHGLEDMVWSELAECPARLKEAHFDGLFSIDKTAWLAFTRDERLRMRGHLTGPLTEAEAFYVEWKARVCHDHGIPVLIDDKIDHVSQGCLKYGIELFDPLSFAPK